MSSVIRIRHTKMNDNSERSSASIVSHASTVFNSSSAFDGNAQSLLDSGIGHVNHQKPTSNQKFGSGARNLRVTFPDIPEKLAQVVEEIQNREDLTEEDRSALWFCADEYAVLKCDSRMESLASERDGLAKELLEGVYTERSRQSQDKLNRWVAEVGQERRGLERSIHKGLGEARQSAQFQSIMDVLQAQDDAVLKSRPPTASAFSRSTHSATTTHLDDEAIRKIYTKASRVSRHFARMMAKADALAVGTSPDSVGEGVVKKSSRTNKNRLEKHEKAAEASSDSQSVVSSKSNKKHSSSSTKDKKVKGCKSKGNKEKKEKETGKEPKNKSTLKQKYKETKAGIIARIPRIA